MHRTQRLPRHYLVFVVLKTFNVLSVRGMGTKERHYIPKRQKKKKKSKDFSLPVCIEARFEQICNVFLRCPETYLSCASPMKGE